MGQCRIVRDIVIKCIERRHLDVIGLRRIISAVAAVLQLCSHGMKEVFRAFDARQYWSFGLRFGRVAVYLGGVEHGVCASKQEPRTTWRGFIPIVFGISSAI